MIIIFTIYFWGKYSNNFVSLPIMALSTNIAKYLLSKKHMSFNVVFTALFAIMTTLLLAPLSLNRWFVMEPGNAMIVTICFWVVCLGFLCISRAMLCRLQDKDISVLFYVLWCVAEGVIISIIYTIVSQIASEHSLIPAMEHSGMVVFGRCMLFCIFSLGVPNVFSVLYFTIMERDQTIRLMNFSSVVSDTMVSPQNDKKIMLYDNSGVLKLVINQNNLYYIESDDNYIKVWYEDSYGELKQYMLRCRLKTIEESFSDSDLVRCHRKYVVNINKIEQMIRQKDGSFSIELGLDKISPINVSKTYESSFLDRFNSRNF